MSAGIEERSDTYRCADDFISLLLSLFMTHIVSSVDADTPIQEKGHDENMSLANSPVQRCEAILIMQYQMTVSATGILRIPAAAEVDGLTDMGHMRAASTSSILQSNAAYLVSKIHVSGPDHEQSHDFKMSFCRSSVKGCATILIRYQINSRSSIYNSNNHQLD